MEMHLLDKAIKQVNTPHMHTACMYACTTKNPQKETPTHTKPYCTPTSYILLYCMPIPICSCMCFSNPDLLTSIFRHLITHNVVVECVFAHAHAHTHTHSVFLKYDWLTLWILLQHNHLGRATMYNMYGE